MDFKEVIEIIPNESLYATREARNAKLTSIELKRIARSLPVPTDDSEVRLGLRARARPVCLFGEDAHDRRQRLRFLMANEALEKQRVTDTHPVPVNHDIDCNVMVDRNGMSIVSMSAVPESKISDNVIGRKDVQPEEEFYTEGPQALRHLRQKLALPSLKRARARLQREKVCSSLTSDLHRRCREEEESVVHAVRQNYSIASHVGDDRPLSAIALSGLSDASSYVVTGSWSGCVKIWSADSSGRILQTFQDVHSARVSNVVVPRNMSHVVLTCSADGTACILRRSLDSTFSTNAVLRTHEGYRVSDVQMHPFRQSLIATAALDGTFALYDEELLVVQQPTGHDRVYRLVFHPDGSLLATCGLEGGLRVWDLRSGRAVMTMTKAHADDALAIQFNGGGRVLASGGMDNVFRIWDLRTVQCIHTVAAHRGLISGMRFAGGVDESSVLFTSSFDHSIKCWGADRDWGLLAAHTSYEDKVTALDCSADGSRVVAACYDKKWKIWGQGD